MNTALTTADLAAAEKAPAGGRGDRAPAAAAAGAVGDEELAPLFASDMAKDYRARWDAIQSGFVDDPKQAVRTGDELVAQVMQSLAESFSRERTQLEARLDEPDQASTEDLRVALRRYRSFFKRLLSL
jgi:hypothetical protein